VAFDMSTVTENILNIGIMIGAVILVLSVLVVVTFLVIRQLKYGKFKVVVWETDAYGNTRESYDRAGIFVDAKTRNKRFFMLKAKVGLDPDNVPYVLGQKGRAVVYLLRTGLKNFRFIKPRIVDGAYSFTVGEEDVNWAVNAYERAKKTFNQSKLLQYMPFIIIGFVTVIILVIFIYFFRNFDVLRDVAVELNEAARQVAQARAGTLIID